MTDIFVFELLKGSPSFIDEVYLKNPMEPPDLTGIVEESDETQSAPKLPSRTRSTNLRLKFFSST